MVNKYFQTMAQNPNLIILVHYILDFYHFDMQWHGFEDIYLHAKLLLTRAINYLDQEDWNP